MTDSHPTRERILDAAAAVMRERGLAGASIKAIATAAGCSVALLYKYFDDQQAIYLGVLTERLGAMAVVPDRGSPRDRLVLTVERLMTFYVASFPMSASIFSSPALLESWRGGLRERGSSGPHTPIALVADLVRECDPDADASAVASLLVGAAFQSAFLACFEGRDAVPRARATARRLVDAALPAT